MNNSDESNKSSNSANEPGPSSAKVLEFKRPSPAQPTLRRRPRTASSQLASASNQSKKSDAPAWKVKLLKGTQIGLLLLAVLLALKNCGKI